MEKLTVKLFIHAASSDKSGFLVATCDMSEYGYLLIHTETVQIDKPEMIHFDKKRAALEAEKIKLKSSLEYEIKQIDEKLKKLGA